MTGIAWLFAMIAVVELAALVAVVLAIKHDWLIINVYFDTEEYKRLKSK